MITELTIPKDRNKEPALDQQQLFNIGLKHVRDLSNRLWNDYNIHDPGITILELLSYAITDLGYRASFPLKDILASSKDNVQNMSEQFLTASKILPNRPLTKNDYRKLIIDLEGVKNAWIYPSKLTYYSDPTIGKISAINQGTPGVVPIDLNGLYDIIIECMDDIGKVSEQDDILKQVKRVLHANRNLCEDFINYSFVVKQDFSLCCELELDPGADTSYINAQIIFQVKEYLSPTIKNYSLKEMMALKKDDGTSYTSDEIFDGPLLSCGFIPDNELEKGDLRTDVRLSDIINLIMDIDGVRAVRDIVMNYSFEGDAVPPENKWFMKVPQGKKATLDTIHSRFVFYKRNMPVVVDSTKVSGYLNQFENGAKTKLETKQAYDFDIPLGNFRQIGQYYSFQNHFPSIYGLNETISDKSISKKDVNVLQLNAYLLFFDQIMANYFAQLSHVKDLFSTNPNLYLTYFYQTVDSFNNYKKIYQTQNKENENNEPNFDLLLKNQDKDSIVHSDRRNRFLDHLISRFAESFTEYANIMYASFGASSMAMIAYKCNFLNNYADLSSQRALAYNYSLMDEEFLWNTTNVSGLEKRLASLLGIQNYRRRNLGDIAYDIYAEIDSTPGDEFRFRIRNKDNKEILLSSTTNYKTSDLAVREMKRAIRAATLPINYQRKTNIKGKYYFIVLDGTDTVAMRKKSFKDEISMNLAIDEVINYVQANYSDEGMFLIENILLRPTRKTDNFLPICVSPKVGACSEIDPYSYRLHIILPAYSYRFVKIEFRRFVEETIRQETPAHILPKICWISRENMAELEKLYHDWIYLKPDETNTLNQFIDKLYNVKNVYNPENLHDCSAPEKFILGQTALGSSKNE
jgi:uncharacterized protein